MHGQDYLRLIGGVTVATNGTVIGRLVVRTGKDLTAAKALGDRGKERKGQSNLLGKADERRLWPQGKRPSEKGGRHEGARVEKFTRIVGKRRLEPDDGAQLGDAVEMPRGRLSGSVSENHCAKNRSRVSQCREVHDVSTGVEKREDEDARSANRGRNRPPKTKGRGTILPISALEKGAKNATEGARVKKNPETRDAAGARECVSARR